MSSKNRNFRKRAEDNDQPADEPDSLGMPPASLVAARKAKEKEKKSGKKPILLSFDEEESNATLSARGQAKKQSKAKLKPSLKGLSIAEEAAKLSSTQQPAAGEYSVERLKELRANAQSFTGPRAPMSMVHTPKEDAAGGGFKLSGSFKPAAPKGDDRYESAQPVKPPEQNGAELPPPARTAAGTGSTLNGTKQPSQLETTDAANVQDDDAADDFHVPSADMIRLAKQKRERLRSAHLAPDYVPLGGAAGLANLESRLKPEGSLRPTEAVQGSSDSDEEHADHRMTFVGNERNRSAREAGPLSAIPAEPQVHGGDEEDDDHWVREQIRKGVGVGAPSSQPVYAAVYAAACGPSYSAGTPVAGTRAAAASLANSGNAALKTLQHSLHRLKMTQANIEKQAAKTHENMKGSVATVAQLEADLEGASAKYTFLQQLRVYIADLCDMLQAKAVIVEELEEHLMAAGEQRAAALAQRCAADKAAELEPASAAVSAALGVLSRGGEQSAAAEAAASAASHAEERLAGAAGPVELDEFGRDISLENNQEEGKRKARIQARDRRWQDDPEGQGGAYTTDESDSEQTQYKRQRREVLDTSKSVFADADEDFSSLVAVKQRLEEWKQDQPDAYGNAYASDNIPAIFAPFVRNELLAWDPIFERTSDFDEQAWYRELLDYGRRGSSEETSTPDTDDNLIPKLVSDLVLPLARHALQVCWNPFSRRQTRRAIELLDHLLVFLPADSDKMQMVMAEVRQRLEAAIGLLKLPAWPQAATAAAPNAAAYLAHQFGKAMRLAANIAAFDSLLPRAALTSMVLERLVQQQLFTYLTGASSNLEVAIKRSERLAEALPEAWFHGGSQQTAKPFADLLIRLARTLENQRKERNSSHPGLARRLSRALSKLGRKEESKQLSQAYEV